MKYTYLLVIKSRRYKYMTFQYMIGRRDPDQGEYIVYLMSSCEHTLAPHDVPSLLLN